eukprot:CAMPEP_0118922940 /NCGR_PEP_ID=MMETSP1169-20130426/1669_1 /TAXON_ID=36882 /ORGANISM="Pyramimonas obovata, Strain CCMP722" /LENGTH=242 /DNA_ID=CAMNT_0006863869 /DNA_START=316 /DNA_END=1041 /DNA_ORIENTATION=+
MDKDREEPSRRNRDREGTSNEDKALSKNVDYSDPMYKKVVASFNNSMRITHTVGGSLAGARWVIVLSFVAWGVRVLRAKNIIGQPTPPKNTVAEPVCKGFARLSPLALRMLVKAPQPLPHILLDVRDPQVVEKAPLPEALQSAISLSETELAALLRPRKSCASWTDRLGLAVKAPTPSTFMVFICSNGKEASQAAIKAVSFGYTRCAVLEGGLDAFTATMDLEPMLTYINRDAVALLLEKGP